jgi:hypothetical protein
MKTKFSIYFDTEFTSLTSTEYCALISIGLISENGVEFYRELNDTWNRGLCSDFVLDTVLPLLEGTKVECKEEELSRELRDFIESFGLDKEITLRSDSGIDWDWVWDLFQFFGTWPRNLRKQWGGVYLDDDAQIPLYEKGMKIYWRANEKRRHHALIDARSLLFAVTYATAVKSI